MSDTENEGEPKPAGEEQKRIIAQLIKDEPPMVAGATYYVISWRWYEDWRLFAKLDETDEEGGQGSEDAVEAPGPIDNSELLSDKAYKAKGKEPTVRAGQEGRFYSVVSAKVWQQLHSW